MRLKTSRLVACSLVGLLAACGSNGGTVPSVPPAHLPSIVTVSPSGAASSFYRVGTTGSWSPVPSTSPAQFTVPLGQTAFSVAYVCNGTQIVLNAVVTDTTNVSTPCDSGVVPLLTFPTSQVSGTFDATAVGATNATIASQQSDTVSSAGSGSGSYPAFPVLSFNSNTYALAAADDNSDVLGFKTLRNVATLGANVTVNFPPLTAADAAITEPISVTGMTGQDNLVSVNYLPGGQFSIDDHGNTIPNHGLQVQHFTPTAYSGVPPADWQTGDLYDELFGSLAIVGNGEYITYHEIMATATGPISAAMPTLSQIPVNPTDFSIPLTYNGLPASDVFRSLESLYQNSGGVTEVDISSPGWLAGRSSYGPPTLTGATGLVTMTPATITQAAYIFFGATYVPTATTDYFSITPPPGQSTDLYVSAYFPTAPSPAFSRLKRPGLVR